jgi:hypothetical protein
LRQKKKKKKTARTDERMTRYARNHTIKPCIAIALCNFAQPNLNQCFDSEGDTFSATALSSAVGVTTSKWPVSSSMFATVTTSETL